MFQSAPDKVQSRGWKTIVIVDQNRLERDMVFGAVPLDGLAGCVLDQGPNLAWFKVSDHGSEACGSIASERMATIVAIFPLSPGTGDNKGKNGGENERQSTDEAGDLTDGELRPYMARHGCFEKWNAEPPRHERYAESNLRRLS